ncbi:MAG: type II toxin-antitoxin system VapC family toxin [Pyrinomonadaceae bacterium]
MNSRIIADTGAIVGLLHKDDQWKDWVETQAKIIQVPFLTCEPVIAEASFLLRKLKNGKDNLLQLIETGTLAVDFSLSPEVIDIRSLLRKYSDVPMSLADACLVRMSEKIENSTVFTTDSDFLIYRKNGRQKIPLISPF